jgi:hypothetical protein
MQDYRTESRVASDGSLTIKGLPFQAGDEVEVIVRGRKPLKKEKCYPLRGTPVRYTDPFGSVAEGDWEAVK